MSTNFQRKRVKPKLDIVADVEKPENRVHRLTVTDSRVSMLDQAARPSIDCQGFHLLHQNDCKINCNTF